MSRYQTPMMQQYEAIKAKYPDCILFFRLGDFYEMFAEDAELGSRILSLTLTSRPEGKDGRVPMCGVPFHAYESYLSKLVLSGHKVAICEQIGPIPKSGLVQRQVLRIVTPGTLLDDKSLLSHKHNYLLAVVADTEKFVLCGVDLSTETSIYGEWPISRLHQDLPTELAKIPIRECLLLEHLYHNSSLRSVFSAISLSLVSQLPSPQDCTVLLHKFFSNKDFANWSQLTQQAFAAVLEYLDYTQQGRLFRLQSPTLLSDAQVLVLDRATILNLELFEPIREQSDQGTLIYHLDQTCTALGARLMREWLARPSSSLQIIQQRQDCVQYWLNLPTELELLRRTLKRIHDLQRLLSRLSANLGQPRDLLTLYNSLQTIIDLTKLQIFQPYLLLQPVSLSGKDLKSLTKFLRYLDQTLNFAHFNDPENVPLLHSGINPEFDELYHLVHQTKKVLLEIEQNEKIRTGISTLRIKQNQVFGYYIEVSKGQISKVPDDYQRRQTLVNAERFITPELKVLEEKIYTAQERLQEIQQQIYDNVLQEISAHAALLQQLSQFIANLDCLSTFAYLTQRYSYQRPLLNTKQYYHIQQGRHPVVEQLVEKGLFVPNNTELGHPDQKSPSLHLLTGPNMAGKSVYMRQLALIVILAHLGCYVPAESADLAITDRLFVRSGASDSIASGLSTFMVEMTETAQILQCATANSLVIMDEIGRGTSTFDGIALAWAIAEYLVQTSRSKVLFATHYHELQALAEHYPQQIQNYHMSIDTHQGDPVFLHILRPGPASHSYGIAVAKQAGLPASIIERAHQLSHNLEHTPLNLHTAPVHSAPTHIDKITEKIHSIDPNHLTPLAALELIFELKQEI